MVGPEAVENLTHRCRAFLAALGDDLVGAELAGDPLAILVAGHGHDPGRAETLRSEHGGQADGTVADDSHGAAARDARAHGGMVTGGVDVGQRQEVGDQACVGLSRRFHERPVGEWHPDSLSLPAVHRVSLLGRHIPRSRR